MAAFYPEWGHGQDELHCPARASCPNSRPQIDVEEPREPGPHKRSLSAHLMALFAPKHTPDSVPNIHTTTTPRTPVEESVSC